MPILDDVNITEHERTVRYQNEPPPPNPIDWRKVAASLKDTAEHHEGRAASLGSPERIAMSGTLALIFYGMAAAIEDGLS